MRAGAGAGLGALRALVELALPQECGGCRAPGTGWCQRCARELVVAGFPGAPRRVRPQPCPPGLPDVWATRAYDGAVRSALLLSKDADRRDLLPVLAPLLADALVAALDGDAVASGVLAAGDGPVLVVPVPSSRAAVRRRGDAVLQTLVRRALGCAAFRGSEVLLTPALQLRRRVADQAGLGHLQRAANLEGAMRVRPAWQPTVAGACTVLADDVLTTGATLAEAARALRAAGARHVVAATVAATARHRGASRPGTSVPLSAYPQDVHRIG